MSQACSRKKLILITVQAQVILHHFHFSIICSNLFFHFRNYFPRDNATLVLSEEGRLDADMSIKNVKTPSLWELIQIDALEKRNKQSGKKFNKFDQCQNEL